MPVPQRQEAEARRNLGILNRKRKNLPVAVSSFLKAIELDPKDHVSCINLAEIYNENKKTVYAVEYSMRAVLAAPENGAYKRQFIELATPCNFVEHSADLQRALHICLVSPDINCGDAHILWQGLLRLDPQFSTLYRLNDRKGALVFDKERFDRADDYSPLLTPFFLDGLKNSTVPALLAFEDFITHLRRWLLLQLEAETKVFSAGDYIKLTAALSHYCLFTDYILNTSGDETRKIAAVKERLEKAGNNVDERDLVLYACYEPLYKLKSATALNTARSSLVSEAASVIQAQITDYFDLQERRKSIISLTEIDDTVSLKVQEQYEEFPYPRWKSIPVQPPNGDKLPRGRSKILVAGCGTGQDPLMYAILAPQAEILAVDLSRSSLAYAMRKAEEFGVKNITFRQADILKLGMLDQQFDYIASMGVLHHMKEPMEGWRVLCGLLKPDGILAVGLYSKTARWAVAKAHEAIARGNYGKDSDGMRQFRLKSPQLLEPDALNYLQLFKDYYNLPMYRDFLFHVQEHRIDIADIEKTLQQLGLRFGTFFVPLDIVQRYKEMFPGDIWGKGLDNWRVFEKRYPQTFMGMYQLWCKKA